MKAAEGPGRPAVGSRSLLPWLALITIYIIWGSTYLAIRVAVQTIPPFVMVGVRYLAAGAILYPIAARGSERRDDRLTKSQWRAAVIIGILLLFGGNGLVSWAEQTVPSGIAALLVAGIPFWLVLIDRIALGTRVPLWTAVGLVVGFAGVVVLVRPTSSFRIDPVGAAAIVIASFLWAAGSVYSRSAPVPRRPLLGTAMSMLCGGAFVMIVALVTGELAEVRLAEISQSSILALAWLIVPGSILAFSAYTYALKTLPTSTVGTYAFVNPMIAVVLGWGILGESFSAQVLIGGSIIVAAVGVTVSSRAREVVAAQPAPETPAPQAPELVPSNE